MGLVTLLIALMDPGGQEGRLTPTGQSVVSRRVSLLSISKARGLWLRWHIPQRVLKSHIHIFKASKILNHETYTHSKSVYTKMLFVI